jgi:hypothetical protein
VAEVSARAGLQGVQQQQDGGHLRLELRRRPAQPRQAGPEVVVHLHGGQPLQAWHEAQRHHSSGHHADPTAGTGAGAGAVSGSVVSARALQLVIELVMV